MVYNWLKNIHWQLCPPVCSLCGQPGGLRRDLCDPCFHDLPWRQTQGCLRCGENLMAPGELVCGRCLRRPPAFDRVLAPLVYQSPVDGLVLDLKFHGRLARARLLGELLAGWLSTQVDGMPQAIVPVPLHARRLRERGFNQALELARPVAHALALPLITDGVRRLRATPPQSNLAARRRHANLRAAFAVEASLPPHVAILDDVVTTGATVEALSRALRRAGVREVSVWALARA